MATSPTAATLAVCTFTGDWAWPAQLGNSVFQHDGLRYLYCVSASSQLPSGSTPPSGMALGSSMSWAASGTLSKGDTSVFRKFSWARLTSRGASNSSHFTPQAGQVPGVVGPPLYQNQSFAIEGARCSVRSTGVSRS